MRRPTLAVTGNSASPAVVAAIGVLAVLAVSAAAQAAEPVPEIVHFPCESTASSQPTVLDVEPVNLATRSMILAGRLETDSVFLAPRVRLRPGFRTAPGTRFKAGSLVFGLHLVAMAADADFPNHSGITTPSACPTCRSGFHPIVEEDIPLILESIQRHFRAEDGGQLVRFEIAGFTAFSDLENSDRGTALYESITSTANYDGSSLKRDYLDCEAPRLRDPRAINVYLFDNAFANEGDTSHGKRANNHPFILVDIDRIESLDAASGALVVDRRRFEHELGHGFGVGHTCEITSLNRYSESNVMGQIGFCGQLGGWRDIDGDDCSPLATLTGGNRERGFTYESLDDCPVSAQDSAEDLGQVEIIYSNGLKIMRALTPEYFFDDG